MKRDDEVTHCAELRDLATYANTEMNKKDVRHHEVTSEIKDIKHFLKKSSEQLTEYYDLWWNKQVISCKKEPFEYYTLENSSHKPGEGRGLSSNSSSINSLSTLEAANTEVAPHR